MTKLDSIDPKKLITPKSVARFVVGSSVRFVVTATITSLVPTESKTEKVKLVIGSYVIAAVVAEKAKSYISDEIDEISDMVKSVKQATEESPSDDTPNP